jgi:hypothetical protein
MIFDVARPDDDAGIRSLLRATPMEGEVRLSLEREPDFFAGSGADGERVVTLVAREEPGAPIVGIASRALLPAFVNGERAEVGYLGHLRLDPSHRGRGMLLTRGFAELSALRKRVADEAAIDFTTIVEDNLPARRLLESGRRGLPRYEPLETLVTLTLRTRRSGPGPARARPSGPEELSSIAECLARNGRRFQLAPCWGVGDLASGRRCPGLSPSDFLVAGDRGGPISGCVALWDQRRFKQVVVRGYSRRLSLLRLLLPGISGRSLPKPGDPLLLAFGSHLAIDGDDPATALSLVEALLAEAGGRGLELVSIGLASGHPLLPPLRRRFRGRELRTVLYRVHWDEAAALPPFDGRPFAPEIAIL